MQLLTLAARISAAGALLAAWRPSPGLAVSLALHLVLVGLFGWLWPSPMARKAAPPAPVAVEILTAEQFAALVAPPPPVEEVAPPEAVPEIAALPPVEKPPAFVHAAAILSSGLGPAIRRSLTTLASDTRFEQLCGVEAMEQIAKADGRWKPERTVAYATADTKLAGNVLEADGAAFFSRGHWYALAFRCRTTPDRLKVLSFDFAIGGPITEGEGLDEGESQD